MVELRVFESCVWKKKKKLKKIMASQQQSASATIFNRHGYEGWTNNNKTQNDCPFFSTTPTIQEKPPIFISTILTQRKVVDCHSQFPSILFLLIYNNI
jgi:hypothetical protein